MRRLVLEQPMSRAAAWAARLSLFAFVVTAYGVVLVRGGQQSAPGLAALGSGFVLAVITLLLSVVAAVMIWNHGLKGVLSAALAALVAASMLALPAYVGVQMLRLPALNDITTDIADPPSFSRSRAVLAARNGHVPRELERVQREPQRDAYQRLVPIITDLSAEEAYALALRAAGVMGWRVIESAPPGGRSGVARIEAIATTWLLRFQDDVTIRIRPRVDGSRIDVRSASRVGRHDLGANAARIQAFADEVQLLLSAR
jgi:uncharacterized protein (DUF1499 family)